MFFEHFCVIEINGAVLQHLLAKLETN